MTKKILWFVVFALMAISCLDEPDCFSLNNNIVGVSFKKLSNNTADTVLMKSVTATGIDSVFVTTSALTGKNLPVNIYSDSTRFSFTDPADRVYDLTLRYTSRAQFVSEDCGEKFVVSDLRAESKTFDSVRVVSTTPKSRDIAGTNIEIFRCPNTTRIKLRFLTAVKITNIQTSYGTFQVDPVDRTTLLLPLNPSEEKSIVTFTIDGTSTPKTLALNYSVQTRKLYNACGDQAVISNVAVDATGTNFTATKVIRTSIQDPNQTNIEITL